MSFVRTLTLDLPVGGDGAGNREWEARGGGVCMPRVIGTSGPSGIGDGGGAVRGDTGACSSGGGGSGV